MIKLGMCGVRGHGRGFLKLFGLHPSIGSVSIADLNPEVRAAALNVATIEHSVATFDELLDLDLDAIGIFTPPWMHAAQAVRALRAGKSVISACPIGLTLDELQSVVDAVVATGKTYMTAETSYYCPHTMYAREAWREGRFGEFVYGEGEYYYRAHAYDFWMRDGYGNMPPMLYPSHSISMIVGILPRRFERVTCVGTPGLHSDAASLRRRPEWEANETVNMTMLGQMSGGGVCRINEMRNVGCKGEFGSIMGTLGSIRTHSGGAVWTNGLYGTGALDIDLSALWKDPMHDPQEPLASKLPASFAGEGMEHEGSHRFLAEEFVRALMTNRHPHNHVWQAARYCAPGIVALESLKRNGDWLDVPDFGGPTDDKKLLEFA